jgi:hypothetical protein
MDKVPFAVAVGWSLLPRGHRCPPSKQRSKWPVNSLDIMGPRCCFSLNVARSFSHPSISFLFLSLISFAPYYSTHSCMTRTATTRWRRTHIFREGSVRTSRSKGERQSGGWILHSAFYIFLGNLFCFFVVARIVPAAQLFQFFFLTLLTA